MGELDELLGDGGRALLQREGGQVVPERAEDALYVHAAVAVEALILRSQKGRNHPVGHLGKPHGAARLHGAERANARALRIEDGGALRAGADALQIQLLPAGNVQLPDQQAQ